MKISVTAEYFVASSTTETEGVCTTDRNDIESTEAKDAKVILTIPEQVDGKFLEDSVLFNLVKSLKQHTFTEYARTVFVPKVTKELLTI